ncbi:MAG: hypothetical protein JXA57_03950 [Armatimonadetes bacterium]|nr:hypothetical protein [Armatimonadota bacterium]
MEPVMFLQWLPDGEYKEALTVLVEVSRSLNVRYRDVRDKDQASREISDWFAQPGDNAQYLFIGAHGITDGGICIGIGATGEDHEHLSWQELWEVVHSLDGGLWLGACRSSECAAGFDPLIADSRAPRHPYIVGFERDIDACEIKVVLRQLVGLAQRAGVHVDEELALVLAAVPGTRVELWYPARTNAGLRKYIRQEDFPAEVGGSLIDFLQRGG